jgi:hypothetical protein
MSKIRRGGPCPRCRPRHRTILLDVILPAPDEGRAQLQIVRVATTSAFLVVGISFTHMQACAVSFQALRRSAKMKKNKNAEKN